MRVRPPKWSDPRLLIFDLAMKRMAASNVLVVGVKGLGVEIGEPGHSKSNE